MIATKFQGSGGGSSPAAARVDALEAGKPPRPDPCASTVITRVVDEAPGVVATPAQIDAWMAVANPGDRFVYASRMALPVKSAGAAHMRNLAARGLVALTQRRSTLDPTIFNYQAERTHKPSAVTRPVRPKLKAAAVVPCDGEAEIINALLPVLRRFARHGRPCPTDKQLGEKAQLTEDAVKAGLDAMTRAQLIRVQGCAAPTYRRVLILSTGAITGIAV